MKIDLLLVSVRSLNCSLGLLIGLYSLIQSLSVLIFSTYPENVLPGTRSEASIISQYLDGCEPRPDISGRITDRDFSYTEAVGSIVFAIPPSNGQTHQPLSPAIIIHVLDEEGQLITDQVFNISISIENNPGSASLSGTLTQTTVGGIATFDNLILDKPGMGFSFLATLVEDASTTVSSAAFNIQRSLWGLSVHYWFDANDLDGDGTPEGLEEDGQALGNVTHWVNKGTGNDLATSFDFDVDGNVGTVNGSKPLLVQDTLNFYEGILFNNNLLGADINDFPQDDLSAAMVFASSSTQTDALVSFAVGSGPLSNEFLVNYPAGITARYDDVAHFSSFDLNDGAFHILSLSRNGSSGISSIQADTGSLQTSTQAGFQSALSSEGVLILGQEQDEIGGGFNASQDFEGVLTELVIYDRALTPAEQQKADSYFHMKYGRTYNNDYVAGNGIVIWNLSDDPAYSHNIGVIGKASDSDFFQEKAISTNQDMMLTVQSGNSETMPDNTFFFWSSNAEVANDNYFSALNGQVLGHLKRVWRVQEKSDQDSGTGEGSLADIGGVNLVFDIPNSFEMPVLTPRLIIDDDGVIGEGSVLSSVEAVVGGGTVTFNNVNLADGDYFTLATDVLGISHVNTTFTTSPQEVVADGSASSRVQLQLAWSDGALALLSKTLEEPVLFTVTGSASIVNYGFLGGGLYQFDVTNTVAEQISVNATIDGLVVGTSPQITFVPGSGHANHENTTMTTALNTVEAACGFSATITLQLADQYGNIKTQGGDLVVLSSTGSAVLSAVTDNGEGSYTATVSNNTVEEVIITAEINGVVRTNALTVSFANHILPAGLGTSIWFRADQGTSTNVAGVATTEWIDQSLNLKHATSFPDVTGPLYFNDPTSEFLSANFNPVLSFEGNQVLGLNALTLPLGGDQRTVFMVYRDHYTFVDDGNGNVSIEFANVPGGVFNYGVSGNQFHFGTAIRGPLKEMTLHTFGSTLDEGEVANDPEGFYSIGLWKMTNNLTTGVVMAKDGREKPVTVSDNLSTSVINTQLPANNLAYMGYSFINPGFVEGQLAELMVFCGAIEEQAQKKIESYLALKYGITLSNNDDGDGTAFEEEGGAGFSHEGDYVTSEGTIIWDASSRQAFHHDIAGLGRDDDVSLHQRISMSQNSDAIVTIGLDDQISPDGLESHNLNNDGTFDSDLSFLLWGNDDGALNGDQVFEFDPAQVGTRVGREWRVSNTNFNQAVVISFDISELPGNPDESQFMLLLDEDGDFSQGAAIVSQSFVTENDGRVNFVSNLPHDTYFTLATTEVFAMLPVTLMSFTGQSMPEGVKLQWLVASESDNSGFRIERSQDGFSFRQIGFVPGQVNSDVTTAYSFMDSTPLEGLNYYRLVDVSSHGEEQPSELISVDFDFYGPGIRIYPNPLQAGQELVLRCTAMPNQKLHWRLIKMQGGSVSTGVITTGGKNHEELTLRSRNDLAQGIYILKILNEEGKRFVFRVIIGE